MGLLKMVFFLDEEPIHTVAYNRDVQKGKFAVPMMEMMAVEVAVLIVKANGNTPDKWEDRQPAGGHHPIGRG